MDSSVPLGKRLKGSITPPCSKSYAQRALAAALLADGRSTLRGIELCRDTRSAIEAVRALGATVEIINNDTLVVEGGLSPRVERLNVGESGLAARLFTPIAALMSRPMVIDGEGTLLHRPMTMMVEPLKELGVEVRDGGGHLPIEVCGPMRGGRVMVDGRMSSQFVTGLLIALPMAMRDTTIEVQGAVSTPYIDMTLDTLKRFGVELTGPEGVRRLPIEDFYLKAKVVDIRPGEIQTAIIIPADSHRDTHGFYIKYAMRNALDIATNGCSVNVRLSEDKKTFDRVRVAYGVAGPIPMRAPTAEATANGKPVTMETVEAFARAVLEDINPRTSWRATKEFRQHVAVESARRCIIEAVKRAGGEL